MSQHDFNIANQTFPNTRADINSALEALATLSSGATAPSTTYPHQWWYDSVNDILKIRNEANSAWIDFATFNQTTNTWSVTSFRAGSIVDAAGGNTVNINGALAVNTTNLRTELNASGSAPIYACRAWVNFNGTGTVAIRGSGNVTSITDNGTGLYTINFTTAMPDANYTYQISGYGSTGSLLTMAGAEQNLTTARAASSLAIRTVVMGGSGNALADCEVVNVAIFR